MDAVVIDGVSGRNRENEKNMNINVLIVGLSGRLSGEMWNVCQVFGQWHNVNRIDLMRVS